MAEASNKSNDMNEEKTKSNNDEFVDYKPNFSKKYLNIKKMKCQDKYNVVLSGNGSSSARCTLPFPLNGKSMIRIRYRLTQKNNRVSFIGVVSDKCDNFDKTAFDGLKKCYGISGQKAFVFKGSGMQRDDKYKSSFSKHCNDHNICIVFDSNESTLTFVIEDLQKIIYSLKLPPNNQWFPAISLRNKDDGCQIVTN
eukprot:583842_1